MLTDLFRKRAERTLEKRMKSESSVVHTLQTTISVQQNMLNMMQQTFDMKTGILQSSTPNVQNVKYRKMDEPTGESMDIRERLDGLGNMELHQGLMLVQSILCELDVRTQQDPQQTCVGCTELETRLEELEKDFDELRGSIQKN